MAINSLSSASRGMAGLASGMDTQSMVDAMLSGTQAKIDKQKATKTQLSYKQTMYRDVLSTLTGFQKNFLSFSSVSNNLLAPSFYNTMSAATKASAFRVTAGGGAAAGKTTINSISQLARAYQIKTNNRVSGDVKGTFDFSEVDGQEIQIELDGVRKTIKLPGADTFAGLDATAPDFETKRAELLRADLQASINKAFGNGINVNVTGSEVSFSADTNREFAFYGDTKAMAVIGLNNGVGNKMNDAMRLEQVNFGTKLLGNSFKFTINGEKFEFSSSDDMDAVMSKINSSDANVRVRYSALEDKFVMESTVSGEGSTIKMEQQEGNLLTAMFGISSGGGITGSSQHSYGDMTGKIGGMAIDYTPGTPMSADDYQKIQSVLDVAADDLDRMTKDAPLEMKFLVNGEEVMVTLPKRDTEHYTIEDLVSAMNTSLSPKGVEIELQKETAADGGRLTGGVTVKVKDGVKFESNTLVQSFLGIGANNEQAATGATTLEQAGFKDDFVFTFKNEKTGLTESLTIDKTWTFDKAAEEIKGALGAAGAGPNVDVTFDKDGSKGAFRIFGVDIPMTFEMGAEGKKLFGTEKMTLGEQLSGGYSEVEGKNAKMTINGIDVERNSNEFTIDGLSFVLTNTFNNVGPSDATKEETIDVTRDTTKIFDGISKFMEEYNKVLDKVWGMLKADANFKEYPPLTDKQKESMSDREVELWETKSKEGLLRGDKLLDSIASTMRSTLLAKPEGAKYSLAEMGITTAYDIEKGYGGMLKFSDTTNPGEKLKKVIAEEPEAIEKLFSDSTNGIMTELNKVIMGATMTNPVEKPREYGNLSLVNMAGNSGLDTASTIYKQIKDINSNLENLNIKYKLEYTRYWKQFSNMEQMISNMNNQSSWLTQQFQ